MFEEALDREGRARAQELFREYTRDGRMLLSTQVVQEFYAAGSRKPWSLDTEDLKAHESFFASHAAIARRASPAGVRWIP